MKHYKVLGLVLLFLTLTAFVSVHKYYVSNTQIEYVEDKKSLQIITRVFIDDFENVLKERYDEDFTFDDESSEMVDMYVEKYLSEKLQITIDSQYKPAIYIGKEIEMGIVKCYLEIEGIPKIETIEVLNQTLFDLFTEQQNIVKLDINDQKKSFLLTKQNAKAVLNFN